MSRYSVLVASVGFDEPVVLTVEYARYQSTAGAFRRAGAGAFAVTPPALVR